jgi:plastocyanin
MRIIGWRAGAALMAAILAGTVAVASSDAEIAAAADTQRVRITHGKFSPAEVRISAGDTVEWVNADHDGHSVTADDGAFDSHPDCSEDTPDKCLRPGDSWSHTFSTAGRYPYHSKTEGQKGVVVVSATKG